MRHLLLASLLLSIVLPTAAQQGKGDEPGAATADAATAQPPEGAPGTAPRTGEVAATPADQGPVAVPEPSEKALRYYRSGNWLWAAGVVWGLVVPAFLLWSGLSARMRTLARRLGRKWFFVVGAYMVLFTLFSFVVNLPFDYYAGFVREHAYGLSNQTLDKWWGDALKGLMVSIIAGVLFTWVPYLLLRKSPRRWWLYSALLAVPFLCFVILVGPIWVAPLFNDFGPMQDKTLESQILSLADRAGIEGSRVYEVNKSVDTESVNAYVSGFLNTKRIVLWDTILAKLDKREILFVMGHEMGHYVLGHVIKSIFFFSGLILASLYLIHRTAGGLIRRYEGRFGFSELGDIASLPLLMLLFGAFFFVISPIVMAYSRHHEHEADRFALELTHDNHAGAMSFVKLQEQNLANPRPGWLYKLWRSSHPPLGERIDFCNSYRPWETGGTPRYADRMRPPGAATEP